jgi:hypothetical protein
LHLRILLLFLGFIACASDDETTGFATTAGPSSGTGGVDTRYHPPTNGVRISETEACDQLKGIIDQKVDDLDCVMTKPTCPNLLRAYYQPACMQYDQGTVAGCVQYFSEKFQCDLLDAGECVLVGYPESAPAGCP